MFLLKYFELTKVGIEGSAAYKSHEQDSSLTQRIMIKIKKNGGVKELTESEVQHLQDRQNS